MSMAFNQTLVQEVSNVLLTHDGRYYRHTDMCQETGLRGLIFDKYVFLQVWLNLSSRPFS